MSAKLRITAHALLRFLERHYGCVVDEWQVCELLAQKYDLDLKAIYAELEDALPFAPLVLGDGKYPTVYGRVVVRNGAVVTFLVEGGSRDRETS